MDTTMRPELGDGDPPKRPPRDLFVHHAAFLATMSGFLIVAVRALAVSRLDVGSALALIQNLGPFAVLAGAFVSGFPVYLMAAAVVMAASAPPGSKLLKLGTPRSRTVFALAFLALILTPWPLALLLCVSAALTGDPIAPLRIYRNDSPDLPRILVVVRLFGMAMIFLLVVTLLLFNDQMWLPSEVVRFADGDVTVGYVLSADGDWVSVFRESDRVVVYFPKREVRARSVCVLPAVASLPFSSFDPLATVMIEGDTPAYDVCPEEHS